MYSASSFIRELSPLLTNTSDPTNLLITRFIRKAEASKINAWLGSRYTIPIQPKVFPDGTIAVTNADATVTGTGTTFTDDLQVNDTIQIDGTKEVLRVLSITSDTELEATSTAVTSKSGSAWFVLPDDIVTASEFTSAYLLIIYKFAEQTSNQEEVQKYIERMNLLAGDIIEQLKSGDYINPDLEEATSASQVNQPGYDDTSDLRSLVETNDSLFINSNFVL